MATEKELDAIDEKIVAQVEESVKFAEESKFPDVSEAFTDVYVQSDYPFIMD
jgi:pyruvate dehydrogenase E1 component alpha subunit